MALFMISLAMIALALAGVVDRITPDDDEIARITRRWGL